MSKPWFVYLVECRDGTVYAGIALDVAQRLRAHDEGRGARYTRGRGPVVLLAAAGPYTHGDALRLEAAVKRRRGRARKLALLAGEAPPGSTDRSGIARVPRP